MTLSLWQKTLATTQAALNSGALQPISTTIETVYEAPFSYQLRTLSSLQSKENDRRIKQAANRSVNPFKPYDPELYVADIGAKHICLLNKFSVIDNHLLLVTRNFEPQTHLLTLSDLRAALMALREIDGVVFYNGGRVAGASQPHKHLQLIPVRPTDLPLSNRLNCFSAIPEPDAELPFRHARVRLPDNIGDTQDTVQWLHNHYLILLQRLQIRHSTRQAKMAYNLLLCREWLMLVPRSSESFAGVSFNALAFCGALLVKNQTQADALKAAGISQALGFVTQ